MIVSTLFALTLSLGPVVHVLAAPVAVPQVSANDKIGSPLVGRQDGGLFGAIQDLSKNTLSAFNGPTRKISIAQNAPGRNQGLVLDAENALKANENAFLNEAEKIEKSIFNSRVPDPSRDKDAEELVKTINNVNRVFDNSEADVRRVADSNTEQGRQALAAANDQATSNRVTKLLGQIVAEGGGFGGLGGFGGN